MTEFVSTAGSFATVWLGLWFLLAALLAAAYPLLRPILLSWHPAIAGNTLLLILAVPLLLSLSSTLFLFLPAFESTLVASHCHEDCGAHVPQVELPLLAVTGLLVMLAVLSWLSYRLWQNLTVARRLEQQLSQLAATGPGYLTLDNEQAFVFTLGWWHSRVYVTRGLLASCSDREMSVILAHERAHSRRRDNVRLLFGRLLTGVLPQRLSRVLDADLHLLIESACDFAASERHGQLTVAETLLKVQRLSPVKWQFGNVGVATAFTGAEIEQRILALVEGRQRSFMQRSCNQLCLLLILAASLALVHPVHHGVEFLFALL